jgi:nitrate/nitrite transport system substrate-binding protein
MGLFGNPFDAKSKLTRGCDCGAHNSQAEHDRAFRAEGVDAPSSDDTNYERVVQSAILRAIFPVDAHRRAFL